MLSRPLRTRSSVTGWLPLPAAVLALALAVAGCGYHFSGETLGIPEDIHSLRVGKISNHSREHGLEKSLAFALEREIMVRRHFSVADDPGDADAVMSGTIRDVRVRPVAFGSNDIAVQYQIDILLDLSLQRQHDGHVIWSVTGLRETDEYSASSQVVVTSSSEFQRQTLDAGNLPCPTPSSTPPAPGSTRPCNPEFSNIQMAETFRRRALTLLLQQAAHDIYNEMVEGF